MTATALRDAFVHLMATHQDLEAAKAERDAAIVDLYATTPSVSSLVREVESVLDALGVDPEMRRGLGASESAIHLALNKAGVKPKRQW